MSEPIDRAGFPGESAGIGESVPSDEEFGAELADRILRQQHGW